MENFFVPNFELSNHLGILPIFPLDIGITDADGYFLYFNKNIAKSGYSCEDIVGRNIKNFYHESCFPKIKDCLRSVIEYGREVVGVTLLVVGKNGKLIPFVKSFVPSLFMGEKTILQTATPINPSKPRYITAVKYQEDSRRVASYIINSCGNCFNRIRFGDDDHICLLLREAVTVDCLHKNCPLPFCCNVQEITPLDLTMGVTKNNYDPKEFVLPEKL